MPCSIIMNAPFLNSMLISSKCKLNAREALDSMLTARPNDFELNANMCTVIIILNSVYKNHRFIIMTLLRVLFQFICILS